MFLPLLLLVWCCGDDSGKGQNDKRPRRQVDDGAHPPGFYFEDELPERTAFLTFDDGPTDWTESILDSLKRENVKATFFVCARWNYKGDGVNSFKKYADVMRRMKKEGHVIASHTAYHRVLTGLPEEKIISEFETNQQMLCDALGGDAPVMTIFRPPHGAPWYSDVSLTERKRVGSIIGRYFVVVLWSREFDSSDSWNWAAGEWYRNTSRVNTGSPSFIAKKKKIYGRIVSGATGKGMVILCHDSHNTTAEVLPELISGLKGRGYSFGTMEDYLVWKYGAKSTDLIRPKTP